MVRSMIINVTIDRPIGYTNEFGTRYPINYGFVPEIMGGDGKEQDVYVLSSKVDEPLVSFEGVLIAIIKRADDIEEKWVVSTPGECYSKREIAETVHFIEQYFESEIILIDKG